MWVRSTCKFCKRLLRSHWNYITDVQGFVHKNKSAAFSLSHMRPRLREIFASSSCHTPSELYILQTKWSSLEWPPTHSFSVAQPVAAMYLVLTYLTVQIVPQKLKIFDAYLFSIEYSAVWLAAVTVSSFTRWIIWNCCLRLFNRKCWFILHITN